MLLEEQWQLREAAQRQLLERVSTQDIHHAERISALEARLGSVYAEEQAATHQRMLDMEDKLHALADHAVTEVPTELLNQRAHALEERMTALEQAVNQGQMELEERLTQIEQRFTTLEDRMQENLEKAAAAAAAKIIREEIAILLAE